jgi:hypothetical protein
MEQIDKVKGIITFKLQYKNRNSNFYESICNIFENESYDEEMFTQYIDNVENLETIINGTNFLFAVREQEDYLIVKDFNKISREISLYIVWQSNKEFAQVCHESIEIVNDLISKRWKNTDRKKSKLMPFKISDSPNITIYPAYINGKKVESDSGSIIKNVLVEKTNSFDKKELKINLIGIGFTFLVFGYQKKWGDLFIAVIPMICTVIYNIWKRYDKKNYKTIIKDFNILESIDDTLSTVEPTTVELTRPDMDMDLNLEGDENV